jgi:hypothetical protein
MKKEFPHISSTAVKKLLPFSSTYFCETTFSRYAATRTKYQNGLNAEHYMRMQLVASKQVHQSH